MPNLKGRLDEFLLSSQVMIENALADAEIGQALSAFGAAGPNFWPKHGCKLMRTEKGTFSVAACSVNTPHDIPGRNVMDAIVRIDFADREVRG